MSDSMDKCVDKDGEPSEASWLQGDLGYISRVASDLLPHALANKREPLGMLGTGSKNIVLRVKAGWSKNRIAVIAVMLKLSKIYLIY